MAMSHERSDVVEDLKNFPRKMEELKLCVVEFEELGPKKEIRFYDPKVEDKVS